MQLDCAARTKLARQELAYNLDGMSDASVGDTGDGTGPRRRMLAGEIEKRAVSVGSEGVGLLLWWRAGGMVRHVLEVSFVEANFDGSVVSLACRFCYCNCFWISVELPFAMFARSKSILCRAYCH